MPQGERGVEIGGVEEELLCGWVSGGRVVEVLYNATAHPGHRESKARSECGEEK